MFAFNELFKELKVVSIPTKTDFRGINQREAVLFNGPQGWSEFSPFVEYSDAESATWLHAALEAAHRPWPKLKREKIAINATLPRVKIDDVARILSSFIGCESIKIKVNDFVEDADLVEAALDFKPDAKIRLDVNGGWDLSAARENLFNYHHRFGDVFEYIEQPCLELSDLATLKSEIPYKIAVDESLRKALGSNFSELKDCADVAIIKWAPSGGFAQAEKLIKAIGLPVVISSALDTGIGISHGLALAASQDNLDYACGLGTTSLFLSDIVNPALAVENGFIEVKRAEPDMNLLEKYQAPQERRLWWEARITSIIAGGGFDDYIN